MSLALLGTFGCLAALSLCGGLDMGIGVYLSPDDPAGGGDTPAPAPVTAPTAKTYTEAEFNALAAERDGLKTERDTVQSKLSTIEQGQLTDQQKADQKAEAAESRAKAAQERVVKAEFKVAAKDAGILDPELALLAIKDKIEFDEGGEPKNVKALLDQLVKDKPFLVAPANGGGVGLTPGASRNGTGGTQTAAQKIEEQFAKTRGSGSAFRIS